MKRKINIIIPIYKKELNDLEIKSLNQAYKILDKYRIIIIKPRSLNIYDVDLEVPYIQTESFDDHYFQGVSGYNKLMLSHDFYNRFNNIDYLLIYQLDAYIFYDNISFFTNKDYDYIGAPWLIKPIYRFPIISLFLKLKKKYHNSKDQPCRQNLYNKVGNGGFSLRKTSSFIYGINKYKDRIDFYLSHPNTPLYNEDVFWAIEVPEFKKPPVQEALKFSFDKYPKLCYTEAGKQLPMGCHGWYKWKWKSFWVKFITK